MRRSTPAAMVNAAPILLADAAAAKAQQRATVPPPPPPPPDPRGTLSLSVENDSLGGSDRYYTNGLQLAWRSASAALPAPLAGLDRRLDWLLGPGALRWGLALGHSIYTPADTARRNPDPDDRPYAGHLHGAASRPKGASRPL
jgi:lipid A 3-O-deacylase